MDILLQKQGKNANIDGEFIFNQQALQGYLILCCQNTVGGMKDKPSKHPDIYHTCYSLSGMALSQNKENYKGLFADVPTIDLENYSGKPEKEVLEFKDAEDEGEEVVDTKDEGPRDHQVLLSAVLNNSLVRINPVYNGRFDKVTKAREYFRAKLAGLKYQGA